MQQLNRIQRRQLTWLRHFKERPVSVSAMIWFNRRTYAILFVVALLTGVFEYWAFGSIGAAFVAVAFGTLFLRDVGFYRRSKVSWPVLREVIAWDKVEQLGQQSKVEA
jgi:hypothetical protein